MELIQNSLYNREGKKVDLSMLILHTQLNNFYKNNCFYPWCFAPLALEFLKDPSIPN